MYRSSVRRDFQRHMKSCLGILKNEDMAGISGVPVVVFANKQDLPNACSPSEVAAKLGLPQLQYRKWLVQGCSAETGSVVLEGMEELSKLTS